MTAERITAAAILRDGKIYQLPPPARHGDVMSMLGTTETEDGEMWTLHDGDQGFVTNTGRFVDRVEGHQIAKTAGQLIPRKDGHLNDRDGSHLFSEDLW